MTHTYLPVLAQGSRASLQAKLREHDDALNAIEGGSASLAPANVFFVAKSWPSTANPAVYYTTIQAAATAANALSPTAATPAAVVICPGTYTENVTLASANIGLIGLYPEAVTLNGNITFTATANSNMEVVQLSNLLASVATNSVIIDFSAKTGGTAVLSCDRVGFAVVTVTGRGNGNDEFFNWSDNNVFGAAAVTLNNVNGPILPNNEGVTWFGTRYRGASLTGNTVMRITGGEQAQRAGSTISLAGTSMLTIQGGNVNNPVSAALGCTCIITGANIIAALSGAGAFDVRKSAVSASNLTGITGTCNRDKHVVNSAATSGGTGATVAITPNFPDKSGSIQLQLVSGPGNAAASAAWDSSGSLGAQVDITDSVNGNVWQVSVSVP